jgi:hypothetical protein
MVARSAVEASTLRLIDDGGTAAEAHTALSNKNRNIVRIRLKMAKPSLKFYLMARGFSAVGWRDNTSSMKGIQQRKCYRNFAADDPLPIKLLRKAQYATRRLKSPPPELLAAG